MEPKVIKNEAEYEAALAHLATLMDAEPGSPQEQDLELFALLIEQYEQEHYPIDPPDPVEAILFRMEQEGLTRRDLVAYIGSPSKVSEVLNRKRPLSLSMIRSLHRGLGIPAEILVREPSVPGGRDPLSLPRLRSSRQQISTQQGTGLV
jgi:HTH-type transcriptional regulator/antitoxin HigA